MLSKLLSSCRSQKLGVALKVAAVHIPRRSGYIIKPTQYNDPNSSKRFKLGYVIKHHWEILPLFVVTATAVGILVFATVWTVFNKVDVTFFSHDPQCTLSRTMDLDNPTIHKLFTINQEYPPWLQMQAVLDKMKLAEETLLEKSVN